jgi:hypothetical protein
MLLAGAAQAGSQAHFTVGATVVRSARVSVQAGSSIQVSFGGRGAADLRVHVESGLVTTPASGVVKLPAESRDGYVVVTVLG